MLIWKSTAQLGTGVTVETTSLWSQTRAASQGPWMHLPCPSLAAISNHGHNFVRGLWPVLLRVSPGKDGDGQALPAAAQFVAARLGPQYWGISARQQG